MATCKKLTAGQFTVTTPAAFKAALDAKDAEHAEAKRRIAELESQCNGHGIGTASPRDDRVEDATNATSHSEIGSAPTIDSDKEAGKFFAVSSKVEWLHCAIVRAEGDSQVILYASHQRQVQEMGKVPNAKLDRLMTMPSYYVPFLYGFAATVLQQGQKLEAKIIKYEVHEKDGKHKMMAQVRFPWGAVELMDCVDVVVRPRDVLDCFS